MAEMTKTTPRSTPNYVWILLAALGLAAYFVGLTIPFVGPDEPRYAQVAREMYERADWITPTLGGYVWFEKPPLLYWLEIASFHLFGVSEFAARLGPALCGILTIASLWILGNSISKAEGERRKTDFGNYLALIAGSTLGIVVFSHGASFDIVVTFTITASLIGFFIFDRTGRTIPLLAFYTFVGLSLLAKGLIGIVFPFAIVGFYYILSRRMPSRRLLLSLVWGLLLACAIAAIWFVPMYLRHGWVFVDEFLIQHHFARFTSNKYQHPQPFYFFLWVLPLMLLPWTPFFIAAIWRSIKGIFHHRDTETQSKKAPEIFVFALSWLLVPLVFFSFSSSKLPGYVLPAMPAAVIITAIFVYELVKRSSRWRNFVLAVAASTFVGLIAILIFAVPRFAERESVRSLIAAADDRGFASHRVLMIHTVPSHNAEFYAAGRLVRNADGKQKRLWTNNELIAEMNILGANEVVILSAIEYVPLIAQDERLSTEVLTDNGELAVAVVSLR